MKMDPKWEDTGLVLFGRVITESQTATFKLTLEMGINMERNVFQGIKLTILALQQ